jgi:hypothetical protein
MIKRREFISRRGGLRGCSSQQAAIGFLKAHRPLHSRISSRHSAMSCVSTAGPTAKTLDFRRSRRKLVA